MSKFDDQYINLCRRILEHGEKIVNYKKSAHRDKNVATAIPDHAAQGASESRTIRLHIKFCSLILRKSFRF